jgi:hypothetical protein
MVFGSVAAGSERRRGSGVFSSARGRTSVGGMNLTRAIRARSGAEICVLHGTLLELTRPALRS